MNWELLAEAIKMSSPEPPCSKDSKGVLDKNVTYIEPLTVGSGISLVDFH